MLIGNDIVDAKKLCLKQMIEAYNEYKTSIIGIAGVDVFEYLIVDGKHIEKTSIEEAPLMLLYYEDILLVLQYLKY